MIAILSRANVNLMWRPLFRLSEEVWSTVTIAMAGCNNSLLSVVYDAPYSWNLPNVCWKDWKMNVNHHLWAWDSHSFKLLKNICMTYPTKCIKSFLQSEFLAWWWWQRLLVDLNNCLSAGTSLADSSNSSVARIKSNGLDDYGAD